MKSPLTLIKTIVIATITFHATNLLAASAEGYVGPFHGMMAFDLSTTPPKLLATTYRPKGLSGMIASSFVDIVKETTDAGIFAIAAHESLGATSLGIYNIDDPELPKFSGAVSLSRDPARRIARGIVCVFKSHDHDPSYDLVRSFMTTAQEQPSLTDDVLDHLLQEFNSPEKQTPIDTVRAKLDETKAVLQETIQKVLLRGDDIDALVAKSGDLAKASTGFRTRAREVKRRMWCESLCNVM